MKTLIYLLLAFGLFVAPAVATDFQCQNEQFQCRTLCRLAQDYCDTSIKICSDEGLGPYRPFWTEPIWRWNCRRTQRKCEGYFGRWRERCHSSDSSESSWDDEPFTTYEDEVFPYWEFN